MSRDYETADALKAQLVTLDVKVNDKTRSWVYEAPPDYGPLGHDYELAVATCRQASHDPYCAQIQACDVQHHRKLQVIRSIETLRKEEDTRA